MSENYELKRGYTSNVYVDKAGGNFLPQHCVDYKENVHEFLGGLFRVSVRRVHNDRFLYFGFRLPRQKK